uniref:Aminotransferase-like plant mobile domain-containing protein n=1 Tax=Aegilops tauschii subsp. strangulata TaxID=200361 RepID=A0A452XNY5_AEGTS
NILIPFPSSHYPLLPSARRQWPTSQQRRISGVGVPDTAAATATSCGGGYSCGTAGDDRGMRRSKGSGRRRAADERKLIRMADEAAAASSMQAAAAAALASLHLPPPGLTETDNQDRKIFGRGARIKRKAKRKWGYVGAEAGAVDSGGLRPRLLSHRRSTCRGGVGSMDEVLHGEVGIRSRFSAGRIREIMRGLTPRQQGYVAKYGFEHFNRIGAFSVHEPLTEWIMGKINPPFSEFRINADKTIVFSKPLVQKILGVPTGGRPFVLHGQKSDKIKELRDLYLNNGLRATIPHCVSLLKNNEDEESFMRTFLLIALAAVLTPTTGNTIDLDYLWAFEDMSKVQDLDWAGHITEHLMDEVQKFQYKSREEKMRDFWVGGCLPLLTIAYMDHLDLPRGRIVDHEINYSVPRICHVSKDDFQFAAIADLHRQHFKFATFGILPFRDRTPYTDNPVTDTEVAEDDLRILSNDQVLSGQWELVEVHEQKIDELVKETQPEALGFAEASIDHFRLGRTDISSNQGTKKTASCERGSSSHCRNTAKAAVTPSSSEKSVEDSGREYESSESDDHPTPPEADYGVIFRSYLSGTQMESVNTLIHKIKPETIVFVATMRKSDVQLPTPLLIISKERSLAAAARFPHENGAVTLQMPGKSEKWRPRFFIEKDNCMLAEATHQRGVKRVRSSHDSPVGVEGMTNPDAV